MHNHVTNLGFSFPNIGSFHSELQSPETSIREMIKSSDNEEENLKIFQNELIYVRDINAADKLGSTFLHYAIGYKKPHFLKILLDKGADPHFITQQTLDEAPICPLLYSLNTLVLDEKVASVLLSHKQTNTNFVDDSGDHILFYTLVKECPCYILEFLLQNGANPNAVNAKGCSALYAAFSQFDIKKFRLLLQHGADPTLCFTGPELSLTALSSVEECRLCLQELVQAIYKKIEKTSFSNDFNLLKACVIYGGPVSDYLRRPIISAIKKCHSSEVDRLKKQDVRIITTRLLETDLLLRILHAESSQLQSLFLIALEHCKKEFFQILVNLGVRFPDSLLSCFYRLQGDANPSLEDFFVQECGLKDETGLKYITSSKQSHWELVRQEIIEGRLALCAAWLQDAIKYDDVEMIHHFLHNAHTVSETEKEEIVIAILMTYKNFSNKYKRIGVCDLVDVIAAYVKQIRVLSSEKSAEIVRYLLQRVFMIQHILHDTSILTSISQKLLTCIDDVLLVQSCLPWEDIVISNIAFFHELIQLFNFPLNKKDAILKSSLTIFEKLCHYNNKQPIEIPETWVSIAEKVFGKDVHVFITSPQESLLIDQFENLSIAIHAPTIVPGSNSNPLTPTNVVDDLPSLQEILDLLLEGGVTVCHKNSESALLLFPIFVQNAGLSLVKKFFYERREDVDDLACCATILKRTDILQFLHQEKQDFRFCKINKKSLLHYALESESIASTRHFLEIGHDPNEFLDEVDMFLLIVPIVLGNIELLRLMLDHGARITTTSKQLLPYLFSITRDMPNQESIIRILVEAGADLFEKYEGLSILQYYHNYDCSKIIKSFFEKQLIHSIKKGEVDSVKRCLECGISVNFCDEKGDTLAHIVLEAPITYYHETTVQKYNRRIHNNLIESSIRILQLLISYGIDCKKNNRRGITPQELIAQKQDLLTLQAFTARILRAPVLEFYAPVGNEI